MNRWRTWLTIPGLFSIWVIAIANRNPGMLQDSDTRVLLQNLAHRNNPWSWFGGDWPLFNHFYRPISTLAFEFDRWSHPGNAVGFGLTNAMICALCIWAAFWFFCEFTQNVPLAGSAVVVFGFAHVLPTVFADVRSVLWVMLVVPLVGLLRGSAKRKVPHVLSGLAALFFLTLLLPSTPLDWKMRIVDWLPGRTASTMALFGLIALAAFARYLRLGSKPLPKDPTPFDIPPTKSSTARHEPKHQPVWLVLSISATALALGCYEQAVMIPALATGIAITFWWRGFRPIRWNSLAGFWLLLAGYLVLRYAVVPHDVSGYQAQQFRSGPGVWLDVGFYLLPALDLTTAIVSLSAAGLFILFMLGPYVLLGQVAGNILVWRRMIEGRRHLMIASMLLAFIAYLPMGWLKFFGHYHYFPGAFFSLFVAQAIALTAQELKRAISPPAVRADGVRF